MSADAAPAGTGAIAFAVTPIGGGGALAGNPASVGGPPAAAEARAPAIVFGSRPGGGGSPGGIPSVPGGGGSPGTPGAPGAPGAPVAPGADSTERGSPQLPKHTGECRKGVKCTWVGCKFDHPLEYIPPVGREPRHEPRHEQRPETRHEQRPVRHNDHHGTAVPAPVQVQPMFHGGLAQQQRMPNIGEVRLMSCVWTQGGWIVLH